MTSLSEPQSDLLGWIIEWGSGQVLFEVVNQREALLTIPDGPRRTGNPDDFHELVSQAFIRHVGDEMYEVAKEGRLLWLYGKLSDRGPGSPPVGFSRNSR